MEEATSSTFGDLLKALRQQKRLTQQELAARIGVHRNTIGSWERGDFLPESKTIIMELARQLQLDAHDTRCLMWLTVFARPSSEQMAITIGWEPDCPHFQPH